MFLNVKDIMKLFGVSQAYAYRLIVDLNKSLEDKGYRVIRGKVPKQFVYENFYITDKEEKDVRIQG